MKSEDKAILSTYLECMRSIDKVVGANIEATLVQDAKAELVLTGIENPIYNSITVAAPMDDAAYIEALRALSANLNLPLSAWVTAGTESSSIEAELKEAFESPGAFYGMLLDVAGAKVDESVAGITIDEVTDEEGAYAFTRIFCESFNFSKMSQVIYDWAVAQYRSDKPDAINYIASCDGIPAGASSLMLDKRFAEFSTAGFYNAGVLPEYRKKQIGSQMASHRIKVAKERSIDYLSIVLMSDAMARGYCERLGFKMHATLTPFYIGGDDNG